MLAQQLLLGRWASEHAVRAKAQTQAIGQVHGQAEAQGERFPVAWRWGWPASYPKRDTEFLPRLTKAYAQCWAGEALTDIVYERWAHKWGVHVAGRMHYRPS